MLQYSCEKGEEVAGHFAIWENIEGNPLPTDGDSPYTREQQYVFDNSFDVSPKEFKGQWQNSLSSKERAKQQMLVNSVTPKDASRNMTISVLVMLMKGG